MTWTADRRVPVTVDSSALDQAISAAQHQLLACAADAFSETTHEMSFPRWPAFLGRRQKHSSDLFARATLANLLLDCAELLPPQQKEIAEWRRIARREADYLASAKLTDRLGGWSYFPDLPQLPPDLDSLATVIRLFTRTAPDHLLLCQAALDLAIGNIREDGAIGTWLISPQDSPQARRRMQAAVKSLWGDGIDADVCANFYTALWQLDADAYATKIELGADYLLSCQRDDGGWLATWYWGQACPMALVTGLLGHLDSGQQARSRAAHTLASCQRADGGWGEWQHSMSLDTALAVWVLADIEADYYHGAVLRGINCLLDQQNWKGGWRASPWIRMDTGRAGNGQGFLLSYQSRTLSTAFALRTLLRIKTIYRL